MNPFRKFAQVALLLLAATGLGYAANVPLVSSNPSISEPSQEIPVVNSVIQSLNQNVSGQLVGLAAPFTTSGTSANTALAGTVPAYALQTAGNAIRVRAWGVNSADANVKTVTLNYGVGPTAVAAIVTGSGQKWEVECLIQNVGTVGSPVTNMMCRANTAATVVTTGTASDTTDVANTAQPINIQMTAATAGTMTLNGALVEMVK